MNKLLHFALLGALATGCGQEGEDLSPGDGDRADLLAGLTCEEVATPTCHANPTGEYIISCTDEIVEQEKCPGTTTCQIDTCGEGAQCCEAEDGCYSSDNNLHFTLWEQDDGTCGSNQETCQACDQGDTCQQGQCVAADSAFWTMTIESANISDLDPEGNSWDSAAGDDALPDPYVVGTVVGGYASFDEISSTVDNELAPAWSDFSVRYLQSDLTSRQYAINVRDADGLGSFEHIGHCEISIKQNDLELGSMVVESCEGASNIRLSFAKSE